MAKTITSPLAQPAGLVERADAQIVDRAAAPINDFEKALGGRQSLINALAVDSTPKIGELVDLLLDNHFDGHSLGYLANKLGLTLTDLLRAFRNATLAKAQIMAVQQVAAHLPAVVEDVMRRAAPYEEACEGCEGTGQMTVKPSRKVPIPDPAVVACTICRGKGKIIRLPELERQRLALELGELVKTPRGAPTFMQQINLPGSAGSATDPGAGSLERMQQAVSTILFSRGSVIDVEPLKDEVP